MKVTLTKRQDLQFSDLAEDTLFVLKHTQSVVYRKITWDKAETVGERLPRMLGASSFHGSEVLKVRINEIIVTPI